MRCIHCRTENVEGTTYCQNCGAKMAVKVSLRESLRLWGNKKAFAGMGIRGTSIAPLAAMSIEKSGEWLENQKKKGKKLVPVRPLEDGSWYCPDCGELNQKHTTFCKGCGRDFC